MRRCSWNFWKLDEDESFISKFPKLEWRSCQEDFEAKMSQGEEELSFPYDYVPRKSPSKELERINLALG